MIHTNKKPRPYGLFILLVVFVTAIILEYTITESATWHWGLFITIPMLVILLIQNKKSTKRKIDAATGLPENMPRKIMQGRPGKRRTHSFL